MPELLQGLEEGALEKWSLILSEVRPPPGPPSLQCWAGGCAASALINCTTRNQISCNLNIEGRGVRGAHLFQEPKVCRRRSPTCSSEVVQ